MQDSLKSNSFLKKAVAILLSLVLIFAAPIQYASAVTLEGIGVAITIAEFVYRIGKLGIDCWQLYKDLESPDQFLGGEAEYLSGLSRGLSVSSNGITAYGEGVSFVDSSNYTTDTIKMIYPSSLLYNELATNKDKFFLVGRGNYFVGLTHTDYVYNSITYDRIAVRYSDSLLPYATTNYPLFSSVDLNNSNVASPYNSQYVFISYDEAVRYFTNTGKSCMFLTENSYFTYSTFSSGRLLCLAGLGYLSSSGVAYYDRSTQMASSEKYYRLTDLAIPGTMDVSSDYPSSTRPSSLMQAIHNYNVDNSYTDNSTTVNYFLAPKDQTPTSDNVVSPAIFDEETWVFTEPATSAQYQSTGWTYDYNTRTYDIDLEAGTFTLDGTDVTRIVSQYGNELATITYYDASGNALATDEYNYVMMAASECALNGHTYNANTTKEPTCNAVGERTYTCSACGDQYVEEIAKTDHVYADHTITKEPTCTVGGISSKTCSTCGDQIIEKLDPLGHDFIAKEITETKYDLPPGTSCPSCSGTTYTFSRQGIIYTLLCSDCNTEWTAEADVTYGSTTYVCSRCGESKIEGDATEETQETWFTKFIYKFKWLSSIGQIYRQLVADITSDAETAAAIADGTVTLDEVTTGHAELGGGSASDGGSGRHFTAPELAVSFGDSDHYGVDWDAIKPLNLSWYAPHKETVDGIVSGILWLGFLFLLIKRAPSIIQGAEMITEDRIKIDFYNRR